jgi:hypothetical protein
MRLRSRFVAGVVLALAVVGVAASVAGAVWVWKLYDRVADRVSVIADSMDGGLQRISDATDNLQLAVERARDDLAEVREESARLGPRGQQNPAAALAIATILQQRAGPDIDALSGKLVTLSDSAVAVASLLQSYQELMISDPSRLTPEQLAEWGEDAQTLSATLRRVESVVGSAEASGEDVTEAAVDVDRVLRRCQVRADSWHADVEGAREDFQEFRTDVRRWALKVSILLTLICVWVGAGQVSLFVHAWGWLWRARAKRTVAQGESAP